MKKKIFAVAAIIATFISIPAIASINNATLDGKPTILTTVGSDTTYPLSLGLSKIYNELPGCKTTVYTGQALATYGNCTNEINGEVVPNAEDPNPQHDFVVDQYPIGSGSGAKLVLDSVIANSYGLNADIGRSSSVPPNVLNAIAFAKEGLSWFHFTKVNGTTTKHAAITNLTPVQLANIYSGNITTWNELAPTDKILGNMKSYKSGTKTIVAGINNGNPATNCQDKWVSCTPIVVYSAQDGSGTRKAWDEFMRVGMTAYTLSTNVKKIFENDASPIIQNGDATNAIFYFSTARYAYRNNISLKTGNNKGYVFGNTVGNSVNLKNYADAIGNVNGTAPSITNIKIASFPFSRNMFMSTKKTPSASVKNYIRFICSADMDTLKDSYGTSIKSLIDSAIQSEGFIRFDKSIDQNLDGEVYSGYCKTTLAK
jgi:ABC-type phosphate transport system substrate-binding protein